MAVSKLWAVKHNLSKVIDYASNPEKTRYSPEQYQALRDVIAYASNEEKTEHEYFVSGINCNPAIARSQYQIVKKRFGKEGGIVAYHGYQSFAPGEVTPEAAHDIGVEFARRMWGEDYQVLVATHLNTRCLHNHFVVNAVNCETEQMKQLKELLQTELRSMMSNLKARDQASWKQKLRWMLIGAALSSAVYALLLILL